MGNCQAIDNATLVIQHPSGRVDKYYAPLAATDIMKINPGHYVALLLTTTLYPSTTAATGTAATGTAATGTAAATTSNNEPLRITRIKLLRPTDTLVLGHTYRLISAQEVMKGLWAKKYAKMQKKQADQLSGRDTEKSSSDLHNEAAAATRYELEKKTKQVIKHDRHRPRGSTSANSASSSSSTSMTAKPRGWHPSLHSISEARS